MSAEASPTGIWSASAVAIVNPHATSVAGGATERALDALRERGARIERLETAGGDAAIVAQVEAAIGEHAPRVLVAAGGDATVRAAAEGIARASGAWNGGAEAGGPVLLVVPTGSGNSAFQTLWGQGADGEEALRSALAEPVVRRVDLVRLRELDRASFLGVNLGLVARVASRVEQMKAEGVEFPDAEARYWAAFGEVLQDLRPFPVRVRVDGELLHDGVASMITVGGVRNFGQGRFRLLPQAVIDDGRLDVCVVAARTAEEIGALAGLVGTGGHVGQPGVLYAQGATVEVERLDGEPLSVEHDGDPVDCGPSLTLEAVAAALPVLAASASPTDRG